MHLPMIFMSANLLYAAQYQYLIAPPVLIVYFAARPVQRARAQLLVDHFELAELKTHSGAILTNLTGAGATFEAIFGKLLFSEDRDVPAVEKKLGHRKRGVHCELLIFS